MNDTPEPSGKLIDQPSGKRWVPLLLLCVAAAVFASDQLVKNWVVANLPEGETVPVIGEFLQWHFVRNPGAAFSMASGATWIFTILAAAVVVVILWQIRRLRSLSWSIFLGLLLGGVLGNLTDRLTREPGFPVGHVIDFISTPWMLPAIYNIADMGIVCGMVLFVLITLFGLPIDGTPRVTRKDREAAEAAEAREAAEAARVAGAKNADAGQDPDPELTERSDGTP